MIKSRSITDTNLIIHQSWQVMFEKCFSILIDLIDQRKRVESYLYLDPKIFISLKWRKWRKKYGAKANSSFYTKSHIFSLYILVGFGYKLFFYAFAFGVSKWWDPSYSSNTLNLFVYVSPSLFFFFFLRSISTAIVVF